MSQRVALRGSGYDLDVVPAPSAEELAAIVAAMAAYRRRGAAEMRPAPSRWARVARREGLRGPGPDWQGVRWADAERVRG